MQIHGYRMLLLTFCVAGCSFDFTDLPDQTRAGLSVQIIASTDADRLRINAGLAPGHDSNANVRTVMTDLLVAGRAVPFSHGENGNRTYHADWSLSELPNDGRLEIRAPELQGLSPSATPAFDLALPMRAGPDTIHVAQGDDVVLEIAFRDVEAPSAHWRIEVIDSADRLQLALESSGYPPAQITIHAPGFSRTRRGTR